MNSFKETQRQVRIALIGIAVILIIGVAGFMTIEGLKLFDAIYVTVITLSTVGYGDIHATTAAGKIFTIFLVIGGLSLFAFGLQAGAALLVSPAIRDLRQKRRIQHVIDTLEDHYIICGVGELVDKTITFLMQRAEMRHKYQIEQIYKPMDRFLDRMLGSETQGYLSWLRRIFRQVFLIYVRLFRRHKTLLDAVVVITTDLVYADSLRDKGLLVIEGEPTDDTVLEHAGVKRARAMMVMLDDDTETLFATLTARNHNPTMYITSATLEEEIVSKMSVVGADSVIAPFDVAGNFLNNATLRPAVNNFFNSLYLDSGTDQAVQTVPLHLWDNSPWIGHRLAELELRERFHVGVIGLRLQDGHFLYAPSDDYILKENEVLLAVTPLEYVRPLQTACYEGITLQERMKDRRRLPVTPTPFQTSRRTYTLTEAEEAIRQMSKHFIICGSGRVARNAINKLNPERPFVIISDNEEYTRELLDRGFRVIHGNPKHESILLKAGVDRAQAIMIAIDNKADSVLAILISRALSKHLLITATSNSDDMIPKLHRSGADRVVSPFHIAAQFVLLATIAPVVNDFFQYVLFNYQMGLETTELYMEEDSPWIGRTIESLGIKQRFEAGVIGIRQATGKFIYAPPDSYEIGRREVLIVTTPMKHSDELRATAHGSETKRPRTLRQQGDVKSGIFSREALTELLNREVEDEQS